MQLGVAIELRLLSVPGDEERVCDEAVVIELGAESGGKLLLVRVAVDEELNGGLEQMLLATIDVLLNQGREHGLVRLPVLHNVSVRAKNGAHTEVELVFGSDI